MNFLKNLYSPFVKMRRSQKMSDSINENRNEDAAAGPSNMESPPKLFKLNVHCFDEIFEYLCIKDLHSFGQTCKRMNKVAGEYFKQNHLSAIKCCSEDGFYTDIFQEDPTEIPGFNKFMPFISLRDVNRGQLKYIKSHINEFESTNRIYLSRNHRINKKQVEYLKKLLPQLEILHISSCTVVGDFYDLILKNCKNLREMYIQHTNVNRINGKHSWLLQKYPKLEHLLLIPKTHCRIEKLPEFFVCNPNVHKFSTDASVLWHNGDIFLNSKAKLDIFCIDGFSTRNFSMKSFVELLNQLHEQGFYKRLHIYFYSRNSDNVLSTQLALVKGLEFLYIDELRMHDACNLVQLTNLRELYIQNGIYIQHMEILANALTNLERLCIFGRNIDWIMPFICRSLKLNKIQFISFRILNLAMLNEERAKLFGARKITIYVNDDVFLPTKWMTRNGDTNLRLIEMRRSNSIEWNPIHFWHP